MYWLGVKNSWILLYNDEIMHLKHSILEYRTECICAIWFDWNLPWNLKSIFTPCQPYKYQYYDILSQSVSDSAVTQLSWKRRNTIGKLKSLNVFRDHFISLELNFSTAYFTCVIRLHNIFNDRAVRKWLPNVIQTTFKTTFYKSYNTMALNMF